MSPAPSGAAGHAPPRPPRRGAIIRFLGGGLLVLCARIVRGFVRRPPGPKFGPFPGWSSGAATDRGVTSTAAGVASPVASRALSFRAVGSTRASSVPTMEL